MKQIIFIVCVCVGVSLASCNCHCGSANHDRDTVIINDTTYVEQFDTVYTE